MKCNATCGVLFLVMLSGCTTANTEQLETTEQDNIYNGSGIVYQYEPIEHTNSPQPYQVIVDEDFELFSDHEHANYYNMKFLYKPDLENYTFQLKSELGDIEKEVATFSISGANAIEMGLLSSPEYYDFESARSEKEQAEIEHNIKEEIKQNKEYGLEEFKDQLIELAESEPVVVTDEEEDLGIFSFMVETIAEKGYHKFQLAVGNKTIIFLQR
ncbi:hypothetical protein [Alkalicoccobacillus plakortidis]|uniref:Lipoprotein n=1 Tax=Alkalicoccobacillus plakortidis TaxID=444060 RepID=A0ABT0XNX7_9BACI|nr:hypothetical protein [Alkalicoccobacillus plakortidis]MCM2677542.1 hypothetical protein [Alkalicoccobacillus plakortidis]